MKYVNRWLDNIVQRAIRDAIMIYGRPLLPDIKRKEYFFMVAVAIYVLAVIGFTIKMFGV